MTSRLRIRSRALLARVPLASVPLAAMTLAWITLASATLAPVALASEAAEEHHAAGVPWLTLVFSTINLGIFLWILARFVLPAVRSWVRERHDRVIQDLAAAAAAKADAERLRAEWQARLAHLQETVEELHAQARRDAERERERILAAARAAAEAIRREAERTAAYQVRQAQQQARNELVRQALQMVEQNVRAQWTAVDQDRFVADFLKQVQR